MVLVRLEISSPHGVLKIIFPPRLEVQKEYKELFAELVKINDF